MCGILKILKYLFTNIFDKPVATLAQRQRSRLVIGRSFVRVWERVRNYFLKKKLKFISKLAVRGATARAGTLKKSLNAGRELRNYLKVRLTGKKSKSPGHTNNVGHVETRRPYSSRGVKCTPSNAQFCDKFLFHLAVVFCIVL